MSTQSPTPVTPKEPRNPRRNPKRNTTPHAQKNSLLTTPPSSPPRNSSPGGMATDSSNNAKSSKKKSVRSGKKPRDIPEASPAYSSEHRYSSSQPNNITTPQLKDSPHYAGPTFHASPAPSALPIPSFLSKPASDSELEPALEFEDDNLEPEHDLNTTPSKPKSRSPANNERSSTPLDFLFKAAVEARSSNPQPGPEADPKIRSPQTDSKALPQRSHSGPTHGIFPLEMENQDAQGRQIGPSFAPSYKERMNALRSSSSPSQPTASHSETDLDEDERRAKTEALKSLLLKPQPQQPPSSLRDITRRSASPNVPHFATPLRTTSGQPATTFHDVKQEEQQPMAGNITRPPLSSKQPSRTQQSALRREVSSFGAGDTPSAQEKDYTRHGSYNQPNLAGYHDQGPGYASPMSQQPVAASALPALPAEQSPQIRDTKKMEDDLRRILKLDSMPSGVQSSYA